MRTGISITITRSVRGRLEAITRDRNASQKHAWRAAIILSSADGVGTNGIMRRTGKSKTCVWRWQERFMKEGIAGLLHDKTRPSRIPPLGPEVAARVVALTLADPPVETTHWTADLMARASGISASAVRRIWKAHGLQPHRYRQFKLSNDPNFVDKLRDVVGLYVGSAGPRHRAFARREEIPWGIDGDRRSGRARLLTNPPLEAIMQIVTEPPQAPTAIRTDLGAIFVSLELSRSTWLITSLSPGGGEKMSKHTVRSGDVARLRARCSRLSEKAQVRSGQVVPIIVIQEAGLDGFWIQDDGI